MDSYLPLIIPKSPPLQIYYKKHTQENSLFICCLQKPLKQNRLKKWFSPCGKIKSIETGETEQKGKTIHYAIACFKHKHSMKRSIDNVWLSRKISEMYSKDIEVSEPVDERISNHLNRMEKDGFTLVTPKKPSSRNKFENLIPAEDISVPAQKRKRKDHFLDDFYNFQVDPTNSLKKMKEDNQP